MQFELVDFRQDWARLVNDWLSLFKTCSNPCVFYHSLFLEATAALPVEEQPTHLLLGYQGQRLVFGLPIQLGKRFGFARILSVYSALGFDHLAPLDVTQGYLATQDFLENLRNASGASALEVKGASQWFADLIEQQSLKKRRKFFKRRHFRCPYLHMPESEKALLAIFSRNFRSSIYAALRSMENQAIAIQVIDGAVIDRSYLDALERLKSMHAARASQMGRRSKFLEANAQAFHTRLCQLAQEYAGLMLFFEAIYQGEVVGSLYGYFNAGRFHALQLGFLSDFPDGSNNHSIGTLLIYQAMLYLTENGGGVFDFLRGADSYKFKWTDTWEEDFTVFAGSSFAGRVAVDRLRLERAIRRSGRRKGFTDWLYGRD